MTPPLLLYLMTFSIVAYDPNTGDFGVAVQSKFIGVGPIVPWAKAQVGAVATQAFANTTFGPRGLELLASGLDAPSVLRKLLADDPQKEQRQLGIIDQHGNAAAFTGKECFYWAGHIVGTHFAVQGNILVSEETVEGMASTFETTKGDLPTKLLVVLNSADQKGRGDARGQQSAALVVVRDKGGYGGFTDRWVDIRVDDHPRPIQELHRIFEIYDMTFLEREDPSNLLTLEGEIVTDIVKVLRELAYLPPSSTPAGEQWLPEYDRAFENWVGINNFENKWRHDGKIWRSIYDYIRTEQSSPNITLKKMSDI